MKKLAILSIGAVLATGTVAVAQNDFVRKTGTENKAGQTLIPEAKDFAIGVDASPMLRYLGNIFNSSGNNAPEFSGFQGALYGKYFLTDKSAIRVRLNLNLRNSQESETVRDDQRVAADPLDVNASTVDYRTTNSSTFDLRLGYEMRRGYGRLQGFWGGEVLIGRQRSKVDYDYGNAMTSLNQSPSAAWGSGTVRPVSEVSGTNIRFGLGGFAGVEYFFAPKIAIGGELGLAFYSTGNVNFGEGTTESFNTATNSVQTETSRLGRAAARATGLQTVTTGNIFLAFHF